jgi:hypothetical protein
MSGGVRKRVLRQRVWGGTQSEDGQDTDSKAEARNVGENLRNVESAFTLAPTTREVEFQNIVYVTEGFTFPQATRPRGVLMILSETVSGSVRTTALTGMTHGNGVVNVRFGLTPGERYATIRLLVIG